MCSHVSYVPHVPGLCWCCSNALVGQVLLEAPLHVVSGSLDGMVSVWDARTGQQVSSISGNSSSSASSSGGVSPVTQMVNSSSTTSSKMAGISAGSSSSGSGGGRGGEGGRQFMPVRARSEGSLAYSDGEVEVEEDVVGNEGRPASTSAQNPHHMYHGSSKATRSGSFAASLLGGLMSINAAELADPSSGPSPSSMFKSYSIRCVCMGTWRAGGRVGSEMGRKLELFSDQALGLASAEQGSAHPSTPSAAGLGLGAKISRFRDIPSFVGPSSGGTSSSGGATQAEKDAKNVEEKKRMKRLRKEQEQSLPVLAVASNSGLINVWDLESGQILATLQQSEHGDAITGMCFAGSHCQYLLTGSKDEFVRVWDTSHVGQRRLEQMEEHKRAEKQRLELQKQLEEQEKKMMVLQQQQQAEADQAQIRKQGSQGSLDGGTKRDGGPLANILLRQKSASSLVNANAAGSAPSAGTRGSGNRTASPGGSVGISVKFQPEQSRGLLRGNHSRTASRLEGVGVGGLGSPDLLLGDEEVLPLLEVECLRAVRCSKPVQCLGLSRSGKLLGIGSNDGSVTLVRTSGEYSHKVVSVWGCMHASKCV